VAQCGAVWCNVLLCDTVCCCAMQCGTVLCTNSPAKFICNIHICHLVWCSVMQCGAAWYSVVQCGAVRCSLLQCGAVWCSVVHELTDASKAATRGKVGETDLPHTNSEHETFTDTCCDIFTAAPPSKPLCANSQFVIVALAASSIRNLHSYIFICFFLYIFVCIHEYIY